MNTNENTNDYNFGHWAEHRVAQHLENKGYLILDRNYKKPWGEIDIIAKKNGILIFIEVKASKDPARGFTPEDRVSPKKLQKLNRVIQTYISSKKYKSTQESQIDIVALTLNISRGVVNIKHFKNIDL